MTFFFLDLKQNFGDKSVKFCKLRRERERETLEEKKSNNVSDEIQFCHYENTLSSIYVCFEEVHGR